jgi:diacylglycerol O-acyltransferase
MQIAQLPVLLSSALGLASKFPAFSTVISNVPGPREQLYWNGASLEGIYPASIVFDGFAMNITLVSYNNRLDFGIIACRRSLPQVQRLIDHLEESLVELEELAGLRAAKPKRKAAPKSTKKTTVKAKTKARPKPRLKAKRKANTVSKPKNASSKS